jgi:hypothetical protein
MTKQELVSRYMNKFADKTLSFGCVVKESRHSKLSVYLWNINNSEHHSIYVIDEKLTFSVKNIEEFIRIWHPITYGSLCQKLYYIGNNSDVMFVMERFMWLLLWNKLLDSTIYEWVENEECCKALLELKDKIDE